MGNVLNSLAGMMACNLSAKGSASCARNGLGSRRGNSNVVAFIEVHEANKWCGKSIFVTSGTLCCCETQLQCSGWRW